MADALRVVSLAAGTLGTAGGWVPLSGSARASRRVRLHSVGEVELRVTRAGREVSHYLMPAQAGPVLAVIPSGGMMEARRPAARAEAATVAVEVV